MGTRVAMSDPCPLFAERASTSLPSHHQHGHSRPPGMAALASTEAVSRSSGGGRLHGSRAPPGVWFGTALVDLFGVDGGFSTSTHDEAFDAELAISDLLLLHIMTSLYMVLPSALPRKVPPYSSFWTRPLSGSSSGSIEPMAVSLKPTFIFGCSVTLIVSRMPLVPCVSSDSRTSPFSLTLVSFGLFSASSVSALNKVPSVLRTSLVHGGSTPSDCQLLGGVWKPIDHPPNAELLSRRPLRSVSPSRPPRFPSAKGLGVSPPASSPRSHSLAGTGGSPWSGARSGSPAGRRARRRCSSRNLF